MFDYLNALESQYKYTSFRLETDLDLSGRIWDIVCTFRGTFYGNDHTITGLEINSAKVTYSSQYNFGLFSSTIGNSYGNLGDGVFNTSITNLILKGPFIYLHPKSGYTIGTVVGECGPYSAITDVTVLDPVIRIMSGSGAIKIGGVCGSYSGGFGSSILKNIDSIGLEVSIMSSTLTSITVGGICGYYYPTTSVTCSNLNVIDFVHMDDVISTSYVGGVLGFAKSVDLSNITSDVTYNSNKNTYDGSSYGGIIGIYKSDNETTNRLKLNNIVVNRMIDKSVGLGYDALSLHTLVGIFTKSSGNTKDYSTDGKTGIVINRSNASSTYTTGISGLDVSSLSTSIIEYEEFSSLINPINFGYYDNANSHTTAKTYMTSSIQKSTNANKMVADDSLHHIYWANKYSIDLKNYTLWGVYTLDNGFWSSLSYPYGDDIGSVYHVMYKNGNLTIPYPIKYTYMGLTFTLLDYNQNVLTTNLHAGDTLKKEQDYSNGTNSCFIIRIYSSNSKTITFKDSSSVMREVESINYKKSSSVLCSMTDYKYKNSSGLL